MWLPVTGLCSELALPAPEGSEAPIPACPPPRLWFFWLLMAAPRKVDRKGPGISHLRQNAAYPSLPRSH